jgi:hypothetical protein
MMKKLFLFGMMGAMALTFGACSSEEEVAEVNPTYDGSAVKTQFSINVGQHSFATRMTAENVQADAVGTNRFLGMKNMKLFAFKALPADGVTKAAAFDLGTLATSDVTNTHSNQFYTLQIPVGTTNFVFYGSSTGTDSEANGKLTVPATVSELSDVNYALTTRYTSDFATTGAAIAAKLTSIAGATGWATATDPILSQLYTNFTATEGKVRAGYGAAVIRMVNDLKKAATELKANNATTSTLYTVADAILTAINANDVSSYSAFPTNLKMPAGAAQLEWDATNKKFSYKTTPNAFKTETVNPQLIAYPAELMYWASSDLRETPNEKEKTDYPDGVTNWANDENTKWTDWNVGAVKASTRAIAMKRNINYGVAGLHSTVEWTAGNYDDNRAKVVSGSSTPSADYTNETFTVNANSFTLTGILVGGQPASAKWNLLPAANEFKWVVYDNKLVANKNESYTLLLDNYNTGTQSDVLVALEFTNNLKHTVTKTDGTTEEVAADFYGIDGIIPAGGTFYLVGKLELSTAANWTEAYENDRINATKRIFAQDRMTVANFKFSNDALKNAYETIPDLQSVAMLFGLSVDIHWLDGLVFNNVQL